MKRKTVDPLEEFSAPIEFLDNYDSNLIFFEPAEQECFLLEEMEEIEQLSEKNVVPITSANSESMPGCVSTSIEFRIDSALFELIEQRLKTKVLPIALRKRLMYQRAVNA